MPKRGKHGTAREPAVLFAALSDLYPEAERHGRNAPKIHSYALIGRIVVLWGLPQPQIPQHQADNIVQAEHNSLHFPGCRIRPSDGIQKSDTD